MSKENENLEEEIVEEKFTERNEEFDEYDATVDGEYYDDEEFDDYYDDYGAYGTDYGQTYENDRLNQVLDNLAAIKRTLRPSNYPSKMPDYRPRTNQPAPVQPIPLDQHQIPKVITVVQQPSVKNTNDVALYNEISQLRNELGRTQSAQEIQSEIQRTKDQIELEVKQNEAELLNKLDSLEQKFDRLVEAEAQSTQNRDDSSLREELTKLVDVNATILESIQDSNEHNSKQLNDLRKRVSSNQELSELQENLAAVKEGIDELIVKQAEDAQKADPQVLDGLSELRSLIEKVIEQSDVSEFADKLIASFGVNIDTDAITSKLSEVSKNAAAIADSELLRQLYELKVLIGSNNEFTTKRNKELLSLYNEFNKVKFEVDSNYFSFIDKLFAIDSFAIKLSQSVEPEAYAIHQALLNLTKTLLNEPLVKSSFRDVVDFAARTESSEISPRQQENVEAYFQLIERAKEALYEPEEFLTTLLNCINSIQNHKHSAENEIKGQEVSKLIERYLKQKDDAALMQQIQVKISEICSLTVGDVLTYSPDRPSKYFKSVPLDDGLTLVGQLSEILESIKQAGVGGSVVSEGDIASLKEEMALLTNSIKARTQAATSVAAGEGGAVFEGGEGFVVDQLNTLYEDLAVLLSNTAHPIAETTTLLEERSSANRSTLERIAQDIIEIKGKLSDGVIAEIPKTTSKQEALEEKLNSMQELIASSETGVNEALQEQLASILDEVASIKDDLVTKEIPISAEATITEESINLALEDISEKLNSLLYGTGDESVDNVQLIIADIAELKDSVAALIERQGEVAYNNETTSDTAFTSAGSDEIKELTSEIALLREELAAYKSEVETLKAATVSESTAEDIATIKEQIAILIDAVVAGPETEQASEADSLSNAEAIENLMAAVTGLEEKVSSLSVSQEPDTTLLQEIMVLQEKMQTVEETVSKLPLESDTVVLSEISEVRSEVQRVGLDLENFIFETKEKSKEQPEVVASNENYIEEFATIRERIETLKDDLLEVKLDSKSQSDYICDEIATVRGESKETLAELRKLSIDTILKEVQELREQVFAISMAKVEGNKGSEFESYNNILLDKIALLQADIAELRLKDSKAVNVDDELNKKVDELKNDLEKIAGTALSYSEVVEDKKPASVGAAKQTKKPAATTKKTTTTATKKSATSTKAVSSKAQTAKPATSKATGVKKPAAKKGTKSVSTSEVAVTETDELISKINRESLNIFSVMDSQPVSKTDEMDVAKRLANQVANKLVMEQLVQQLGDGGVPQSRVEEIVKEILPSEFTTIQIDEQSDSVRRLANSLVLERLRSKLKNQ